MLGKFFKRMSPPAGPPAPLLRRAFDAAALLASYPPQLRHPHKRMLLELAFADGDRGAGTIAYSRWPAMPLPDRLGGGDAGACEVVPREAVYDYQPLPSERPAVEWHVNFADPRLFVAYGTGLFAQDEMQVAEHPVLGSLREALLAEGGGEPLTVEDGSPTPVLLRGVERRLSVATDVNEAEGRPGGLYGNRFGRAPADAVRRATRALRPPTITNLIAIAAPTGGPGLYTADEVRHILTTAYSGFAAAAIGSEAATPDGKDAIDTVVHTGWWGCGAFGGNRTLMASLQIAAARMAGLRRLVFHTVSEGGSVALSRTMKILARDVPAYGMPTAKFVRLIADKAFEWGTSDGN